LRYPQCGKVRLFSLEIFFMNAIRLPSERRVGHLTLHRQGRSIDLAEFNALAPAEQLSLVQQQQGKNKYNLLLNAKQAADLVPQLHPQELYLTINEVGPESASEILNLASPEQITLLLDLDCWEEDRLSPVLSLHWLEMLQAIDETSICRLIREMDTELLALMLKKHMTIIHGIEVFDDDDLETAKRLEALYDIDFASETAAKVIGSLLKVWMEQEQESYLLLMEMLRSESLAMLEEEIYQSRSGRLLDLGLIPHLEARSLYSYLAPERFQPGGKEDYRSEADSLPEPSALLAYAEPDNLLADIFAAGIDHESACELMHLVNRVMSAERVDFSSKESLQNTLQACYDRLNLALEYLSSPDGGNSREIFQTTYLVQLFQLGHSLLQQRRQRAEKIAAGALYPHLDYPELLFIDALLESPAYFYRNAWEDRPSHLQPIRSLQELKLIDQRLEQIGALEQLFLTQLPFGLPTADETVEQPSLAQLFITAIANQYAGRDFFPEPLRAADLAWLKQQTLINRRLDDNFRQQLHNYLRHYSQNCAFFAEFCLDLWEESLRALSDSSVDQTPIFGFLLAHEE
jgi:hypothetical protein